MRVAGLDTLIAVRHGRSVANEEFARVSGTGETPAVSGPDAAVALAPAGRQQAAALGRWLARLPADQRPEVVISSPYLRARQTVDIASASQPASTGAVTVDPRLRDREMGTLALLTRPVIQARHPAEHEKWQRLGWFDYRPPGGESMADVRDRVGEFLQDLHRHCPDRRVLVVAHDAVVLMLRHLIDEVSLPKLRHLAEHDPPRNAAPTIWRRDSDQRLRLVTYNDSRHLGGG